MKNLFLLIGLMIAAIVANAQRSSVTPTPVLYIEFVMHNEADDLPAYNRSPLNYLPKRDSVKQFADSIRIKGAKLNFQSDWAFLDAVSKYDNGSVLANTNGKNIIKWMQEDNNNQIEIDCHTHQNTQNYTDVYYYHRHIGVTPSTNVGGFVYDTDLNPSMPGSDWTAMQIPLSGYSFGRDSIPVQFDVLWGGNSGISGSGGHDNPAAYFGMFHPTSLSNFFTNTSTNHLIAIGNGCENELSDTTHVEFALSKINTILNNIASGKYSKTGFYYTRIMMNVRDLNSSTIQKAAQLIAAIQPYTTLSSNRIQWKTITEAKNAWLLQYGGKAFEWACDSMAKVPGRTLREAGDVAGETEFIEAATSLNSVALYPNPCASTLLLAMESNEAISRLMLYSSTGQQMPVITTLSDNQLVLHVADYPTGIYFLNYYNNKGEKKSAVFTKRNE